MVGYHSHNFILAFGWKIETIHLVLFVQTTDKYAFNIQSTKNNMDEHYFTNNHLKSADISSITISENLLEAHENFRRADVVEILGPVGRFFENLKI